MLWIKALHIVFVASWFATLFYLPRIFVNLAQVDPSSTAEHQRLLGMGARLYRFGHMLAVPALGLGLWLWWGYGIGMGQVWMHVKLFGVLCVLGYHHACGALLKRFQNGSNIRSQRWYRWFNEAPVLLFTALVVLVVVKPF